MFEVGQRVRRIIDVTGRYHVGTISTVTWASLDGRHILTDFDQGRGNWRADKFELVVDEQSITFYCVVYKNHNDQNKMFCFTNNEEAQSLKADLERHGRRVLKMKKLTFNVPV